MNLDEALSKTVRMQLTGNDLKAPEIARSLNCTGQSVYNAIHGRTTWTIAKLASYSDLLDMKPSELLGFAEQLMEAGK